MYVNPTRKLEGKFPRKLLLLYRSMKGPKTEALRSTNHVVESNVIHTMI